MAKEKALKAVIEKQLSGVDLQRIEADTGLGIPDINACWEGTEFWVENKKTILTKKKGSLNKVKIGFRKEQYNWARCRYQAGGIVILGVKYNGGQRFFAPHRYFYLYEYGMTKEEFLSCGYEFIMHALDEAKREMSRDVSF